MVVELSTTGAAYIRYRVGERVEGDTIEIGGEGSEALADLNGTGDVIGIEIVDVNIAESIDRARAFAAERSLPFPHDIASAARGIAAA